MPSYDRALHALRSWLDSWAGIGHVAVEMRPLLAGTRRQRPAWEALKRVEED